MDYIVETKPKNDITEDCKVDIKDIIEKKYQEEDEEIRQLAIKNREELEKCEDCKKAQELQGTFTACEKHFAPYLRERMTLKRFKIFVLEQIEVAHKKT